MQQNECIASVSLIRRFPLDRTLLALAFVALLATPGPAAAGNTNAATDVSKPLPLVPLGTGAEYALVVPGAGAPDFSYENLAGGRARLRDLRAQGHVLLVFGATEAQLSRLQEESEALERLGVVPVAVLDWRTGSCRGVVKKLGLTFPVVPDPQRTIGAQYNALDPRTHQDVPAWFVVDRGGRVRGADRLDWPRDSWATLAANSLGLPAGDASVPASHSR
jgi:peroxiredoxin